MLNRKTVLFSFIALLLLLGVAPTSLYAQDLKEGELRLKVVEKGNNEPIPGAYVYHGPKVYVADLNGFVTILNVKKGRIKLSAKAVGYLELKDVTYNVSKDGSVLHLYMVSDVHSLEGVTVETQRRTATRLQQSVALEKSDIERGAGLSVGKLLENLPGVSLVSTGSTISKPVIQGMHGSRILLVQDGVRLESQSWGDDHAPEIDHTSANIIEVIKGAETIRYGYGAMGGVVLFNQAPLPYGHDHLFVKGRVIGGYDTNARAGDMTTTIDLGYKDFGLRLHGLYQRGGDYRTAAYRLNNTGYNTITGAATLGWKGDSVSVTLSSNLFYSRTGIYYASKTSDINQLLTRFEAGRPDEASIRPFSYHIEPPFQQTQHFTLKADVRWKVNEDNDLSLLLSYQDNLRQEFENRKDPRWSWLPVQDLLLTSSSADALWSKRWDLWDMQTQVGGTLAYQYNYNIPGTKQPAFIPNYAALTAGYFAVHKAQLGKLHASAGFRYDVRAMDVDGYSSLSSYQYYDDFRMFYNFSTSFAAHYQFNENWDARANLGWAWRPPDVNELYAVGLSHGTHWVVGNKDLTAESGYKAVVGSSYRNEWIVLDGNFFFQKIDNYIYDNIGTGADRFHNHPSGKYPKFVYTQDNTRFLGGDFVATIVPIEGLTFVTKGEWIFARNLSKNTWLPFMPSDRYTEEVSYSFDFGKQDKWKARFSLEGMLATKQLRFDPKKDLVAETPPAYFLLTGAAEIGYDLGQNKSVKLMLTGDNILNNLYKEYTDRFRYYAHARGAQFTLRTIINF